MSLSRPKLNADGSEKRDAQGAVEWEDRDDIVQGVVLLRKGDESLPALRDVKAKIEGAERHAGPAAAGHSRSNRITTAPS